MNHDSYPDSYIAGILQEAKSFAMVGASANTRRPSYFVLKYLIAKGYRVFPINPGQAGGEILGQKVFARIGDLEEPVDVVDIFRNSEAALGIVRDAIGLKDKLGIKVIWMQLGVRNDEAAAARRDSGPQGRHEPVPQDRIWPTVGRDRLGGRQQPAYLQPETGHARKRLSAAFDPAAQALTLSDYGQAREQSA